MNLMEIGKSPEKTKRSENITESWNQSLQETEESPVKIKVERDILKLNFEKARELMRIQKQQIQDLEEEKQTLLSDRQRLRGEVQKSIGEMHRLETELSETQRINQSLQQSNDDLRNRNGLMSRSEQEQLEKEIRDVRDQNFKLQIQVKQSSVEAVEQAQKEKEEVEKKARTAERQEETAKKRAEAEIQKARKKAKAEVEDMIEKQFFWDFGYLTIIFFSLLQNGAFQRDVLQLITILINWCKEYVAWFEQLEYVSSSAGEMVFKGFASMLVVAAGILGGVFLVWFAVEQYKKVWDDLYKIVLISSVSFVAVLGDLIRAYLPVNLLLVVLLINAGTIMFRAYLKNKYD